MHTAGQMKDNNLLFVHRCVEDGTDLIQLRQGKGETGAVTFYTQDQGVMLDTLVDGTRQTLPQLRSNGRRSRRMLRAKACAKFLFSP